MPHLILMESINTLQGPDTTGTGALQTLKGYLSTIGDIEAMETTTSYQAAILGQSEVIEGMMTSGFTAEAVATAIDALTYIIDHLEDYE